MPDCAEFRRVVGRIVALQRIVLGIAVGTSAVAALTPIAPPWPETKALSLLSAVIAIFAIAIVFLGSKNVVKKDNSLAILFAAFSLMLVVYLFLRNAIVLHSAILKTDITRGLWCSERALLIKSVSQQCPLLPEETLAGMDMNPEFFWSPVAIVSSQTLLLMIWLVLCAILSTSAAQFAVMTRPTRPRPH